MTSAPLLSRNVTIYRQWSYLELWLDHDALFADPAVAWCIFNDAPDDPCPPALRARLASRGIVLVELPCNVGRSEARNHCARLSAAPWLEFIDGDDLPLPVDPAWLRTQTPDRLLHYPHRTYTLVDGRPQPAAELEAPSTFFWDIGFIRQLPVLNCRPACMIYPTAEFHRLGGFDGRFDTCEDLHLIWKFDRHPLPVASGPAPKQLYRVASGQSADPLVIGFYTHRLLRLAAHQVGDATLADGIHTQADAQALRAIRALHDELVAHHAGSHSRHVDTPRDVVDFYWRARDTYLKQGQPGFVHRLKEAIKLLRG